MHPFYQSLQQGVKALNLELSSDVLDHLLKYQDALVLWNKAFNLTAIRDPKEMLVKHLLDSLSILPYLPEGRLIDIGTGGGMPGLIIALCQPERTCVLLDSNGKKIRFLKQFIADMKLPNVQAVQTRVEDQEHIDKLGHFDVITSRAFASLLDFVSLSKPYMHEHSVIAAMKGVVPTEELAQLSDYQQQVIQLKVPHLDEQRHLILLSAS
ncbi:16S rRNA (guanine(527)-N(7))-methyltransferase RsmG [Acinetobacter populi]|jgi:16S rRNA (guanine527-N7)-methyltransferase|uniref:Ribosomal RNA small subunit methyltransferase G n=1 Tax=Acinetobacter populi TaxID=1582270 RepID=A0A1Z9YXK8_9GAMM|nr:16S rRNA (guanine(527)-N(7))-methyltransferase RsmG [Acinetobacter populi]MCH4246524.1 16S rRNA (guanine(527)-N(7))-methyltransferase RsmG [Acinetobacter populi]OUY06937.1 16S rRNA (guanine(527)-N(7))-methyltransferase RsmG [Acinetobacter populi]